MDILDGTRGILGSTCLLAGIALGGCGAPPPESPAAVAARHGQGCREAGLAEGTPEFRLCLLLQRTDDRLAAVERRLARIDRDTGFASPYVFAGPYLGPRWWHGYYR